MMGKIVYYILKFLITNLILVLQMHLIIFIWVLRVDEKIVFRNNFIFYY